MPWWIGYLIDNPIRRLLQQPDELLKSHIESGMIVLDIGCGMGIFTIAAARLVGNNGRVIAADLQPQMLRVAMQRAARSKPRGLATRIQPHLCRPDTIGLSESVDFIIASNMVHETPDHARFLTEVYSLAKPGRRFLVLEPRHHVTVQEMNETINAAEHAGFRRIEHPPLRGSHAALFERPLLT